MNLKKLMAAAVSLVLASGMSIATAAEDLVVGEIKAEIKDASQGKGYGGLSGVMMGAASGGPVGAVVGAVAGMFSGGTVQHNMADGDKEKQRQEQERLAKEKEEADKARDPRRAYVVQTANGELRIRSPNQVFQVGDKVEIIKGRLRLIE